MERDWMKDPSNALAASVVALIASLIALGVSLFALFAAFGP